LSAPELQFELIHGLAESNRFGARAMDLVHDSVHRVEAKIQSWVQIVVQPS
jgi:hypothetical protein